MKLLRIFLASAFALAITFTGAGQVNTARSPVVRVLRFLTTPEVEIAVGENKATLHVGEHLGQWTLVELVPGKSGTLPQYAVLEDFEHPDGHLVFIDTRGVQLDLAKSLEPTSTDTGSLYWGHTVDQIMNSASDLLGTQILAKPGDPDYEEVARAFPPIRKIKTYSFVGTPETIDKVGFVYGGRTPDFDPAPYYLPINQIREQGHVWDGLVGGYLPVLRFVYP